MENAQDPGPKNKPNRPQARSGGANRKPQPTKKPIAKRPAGSKPNASKPSQSSSTAATTPVKPPIDIAVEPGVEAADEPVVAEEQVTDAAEPTVAPETGLEEETAEQPVPDQPVPEQPVPDQTVPVEHAPAPRLNIARLTLPKLTLPKFSVGGTRPVEEVVESDGGTTTETAAQDGPAAAPADEEQSDSAVEDEPHAEIEPALQQDAEAEKDPEAEAAAEEEPAAEADAKPKTAAIPIVAPKTGAIAVVKASTAAVKTTPAAEIVKGEPKKKVARSNAEVVLIVEGLTKKFDDKVAVNGIDLEVHIGAFYGIVGPNGAGKTTTLSMITGLLRPDAGAIAVHGADVWSDPVVAKRNMGVLPDRLRLFDRLTGGQVLYYAGVLRGLDETTVRKRTTDLAGALGLEHALGRLVTDYSAGMTKKVALAAAMIHSPRLLVLDEPFESVDPVSAATITDILKKYAEAGGTVVLSSHSMDLVQRICDHVAVIVGGDLLADGTMASVRDGRTLEERFVELAGGRKSVEGLEWLHSFSD